MVDEVDRVDEGQVAHAPGPLSTVHGALVNGWAGWGLSDYAEATIRSMAGRGEGGDDIGAVE